VRFAAENLDRSDVTDIVAAGSSPPARRGTTVERRGDTELAEAGRARREATAPAAAPAAAPSPRAGAERGLGAAAVAARASPPPAVKEELYPNLKSLIGKRIRYKFKMTDPNDKSTNQPDAPLHWLGCLVRKDHGGDNLNVVVDDGENLRIKVLESTRAPSMAAREDKEEYCWHGSRRPAAFLQPSHVPHSLVALCFYMAGFCRRGGCSPGLSEHFGPGQWRTRAM
jgi:hypothetical protein